VLLTAAAASLLLARGVDKQAAVALFRPSGAGSEPPLLVIAHPELDLSSEALNATLAALAAELGIQVPRATLRTDEPMPARLLRVRLFGASLVGQQVATGEDPLQVVKRALAAAASELLTVDQVQQLLDELQRERPALVREVVPRRIELPRLTALLRCLLDERVWPIELRAVLETLAPLPKLEAELPLLVEQVRAGLGRYLVHGYVRASEGSSAGPGPEGLPALLLDAEIEELVRDARRSARRLPAEGALALESEPLAIEPELQRDIVQSVLSKKALSPGAVVLCHSDVRRQVQRLLGGSPEALPVLAYSELPPSLPVLVMGRIEPGT
jgi:type III secretion protein V